MAKSAHSGEVFHENKKKGKRDGEKNNSLRGFKEMENLPHPHVSFYIITVMYLKSNPDDCVGPIVAGHHNNMVTKHLQRLDDLAIRANCWGRIIYQVLEYLDSSRSTRLHFLLST